MSGTERERLPNLSEHPRRILRDGWRSLGHLSSTHDTSRLAAVPFMAFCAAARANYTPQYINAGLMSSFVPIVPVMRVVFTIGQRRESAIRDKAVIHFNLVPR